MTTATRTAESRLEELWETPRTWYGELATLDHKKIGKRYLLTAFVFLVIGGVEAAMLRAQLTRPGERLIGPEAYNQIFTLHGVTMIFWYASPILSGFGNYLVPLMIGARDMAYPRLNAFSYWSFLFSGLLLYAGLLVGAAPAGGWFAYVPLTDARFSPGAGMDFYALALLFLSVSTTAGAVNFITTILRLRAPGMTLSRMPLMMWSTLTVSFVSVLALPALTVACVFLELQRKWGFHFFDPAHGGDPVLWQHLFWFFGHPWVYVIFLPATGMISVILPVFCRRPIVGYTYVALATMMTGLVGFGVWAHHMFAGGMAQLPMSFFGAASITISLASTVQVFAWLATIWTGRPVLRTPMLFALGFIVLFTIGGLSGVASAMIPFDWQITDTYFIVAHIHYVLVGANVFPVFAAFYYWLPKMTGRMMDERLGRWNFWLMFFGFNLAFFPMHVAGLLGMPRRIYTYPAGLGWSDVNLIETIGSAILVGGIVVGIWNFVASRRTGALAGKNPWNADTLEWTTESPPPAYGTVHLPTVTSRHPLWDAHPEEKDADATRVLDETRTTFATRALTGTPLGISLMPEDSLIPLVTASLLALLFTSVLFRALWLTALAALAGALAVAYWLWPGPRRWIVRRETPA